MTCGEPPHRLSARTLGFEFLLLLSGLCGISYEVLYARLLSGFIGDQFAISASVLITFLAGIGLGSLYAHRLWRWLWAIEALIGLCGAAFAIGAGSLGEWVSSSAILRGGLGTSVLVCILLLSLPAFLIGCSLPLFSGYLQRLGTARAFHRAYGVYNVGAALTVLAVEFWLLRRLGVRATVLTMASINGLVSAGLAFGFRPLRRERPRPPGPQPLEKPEWIALVIASVASAVFQLLMVKLSECVFGPLRETFALVLALILLGIALGSSLVERWRPRFSWVLLAGLAGLAWTLGGFDLVVSTYAALNERTGEAYLAGVLLRFVALAAIMGLPATAFGATIPALLRSRGDLARDSGRLLFLSSMANVLGFLLMAFVLHRLLDYGVLALVVAGLGCASVLAYERGRGRRALAAVALFLLAIALHRTRWDEKLLFIDYINFSSTRDLQDSRRRLGAVESFKGHQDVFSLVEMGDEVAFFINGWVSFELGSVTEPVVGAVPAMLAPRTDRAMVLGLGSGMTGGSVGLLFDRTDAVEINPTVVENLWRMRRWNFDVESMPGVRIVVDDGMHFMRASKERYSLIVNTVTSPLYFSASKLYTREFLAAVRERLTPDGLYATWVDVDTGDRGFDIILRTLRESFRECWLIGLNSKYFLLVCSNEPISIRQPHVVTSNKVLSAYFHEETGIPAAWLSYSVLHTRALDLLGDTSAPINTLDRPELEFAIGRATRRSIDRFLDRLIPALSPEEIRAVVKPALDYDPIDQLVHLEIMLGHCAILDRWSQLAAPLFKDFKKERDRALLQHHASWALFAKTPLAHSDYAWYLDSFGFHDAAIDEYKRALEMAPEKTSYRLSLAKGYEGAGDPDSAAREYATILRRHPAHPDANWRLGKIALEKGRCEEALPLLTVAANYYRTSANAQYALGQALERLDRLAPARRSFARAVALEPGNKEMAGALSRVSAILAR